MASLHCGLKRRRKLLSIVMYEAQPNLCDTFLSSPDYPSHRRGLINSSFRDRHNSERIIQESSNPVNRFPRR